MYLIVMYEQVKTSIGLLQFFLSKKLPSVIESPELNEQTTLSLKLSNTSYCARVSDTLRASCKNEHIPSHYTGICNRMCHGDRACNVYITRSRFRRWCMYAEPCRDVHTRAGRTITSPHVYVRTCVCMYTRLDSHGALCALCCARGHDNSAEKPRNICPAAINSETAPTFLANLHKTVTYHSIIRPIRPCHPSPASHFPVTVLPPFPGSLSPFLSLSLSLYTARWFGSCFICRFFRALHFPQFPTNPLDVTGMRGRKRTLCDRVTRYGAANSTLACFRPNYNTLYPRTIDFHLSPSLSLFFTFANVIAFFSSRMFQFNLSRE